MALPAAFMENPVLFIAIFTFFAPLIWWKWNVTGSGAQKSIDDLTHGLRTDASARKTRHDTGVGTKDVLVMRPAPVGKVMYFTLFFFGGGVVFYPLAVLRNNDTTTNDWFVFALCLVFTVMAMIVIEQTQTRIYVDLHSIQKRRVLHRRQTILFSEIVRVAPFKSSFTYGLMLYTNNGREMAISARFSGYRQLMERLKPIEPIVGLVAALVTNQNEKAR